MAGGNPFPVLQIHQIGSEKMLQGDVLIFITQAAVVVRQASETNDNVGMTELGARAWAILGSVRYRQPRAGPPHGVKSVVYTPTFLAENEVEDPTGEKAPEQKDIVLETCPELALFHKR